MSQTPRMPVAGRIARALGIAVLALLALEAVAVAVFRTQWRPAIDVVRRFNRAVLNPAMLRVAGGAHWYASVVYHVGRKSRKPYATPVVVETAGDRLYIPLPYGSRVDWCVNVLAAGGCAIEHRGERLETGAPVIVPADEAAPAISVRSRRRFRLYGVDSFLRLDVSGRSSAGATSAGVTSAGSTSGGTMAA